MRIILDTNVFISGIFWEGNFCSQVIDEWRKGKFELISSADIINELVETLKNFKIQMPKKMIEEWKNLIIKNSIITETSEKLEVIKEDSEDNKFLEAAVSGRADFIVSQDKHLLKLNDYQKIKIIGPKDFLEIVK